MAVCPKCGFRGANVADKCPNDELYLVPESSISAQKKDRHIGQIVGGKFIIISLISEGGMGAVYRAIQTPVDREVALKVLKAELESSAEGAERFLREARAVSKLSHPNIITLFDFGVDQGLPFMAMEYAPGVSLAKWIENDHLSLERILHVISQTASALTEAHSRGIVHRDLKPENIIIAKSGNDHDFVKLLDFGIARVVNATATKGLTREGEVYGTPHYMAPEQAKGEANIGPPADVYAMGIMLYQMLCGKLPFDAPTPLSVLYQHLHEPIPAIEPRPGVVVSPELELVVRTATQKAVQDRFQSGAELLSALEEVAGIRKATTQLADQLFGQPKNTVIPGSQPIVQPTQNVPAIGAGSVYVHDPDPSIVVPMEANEEPVSRALLGFVALLFVSVLSGAAYLLVDMTTSPENPTPEVVAATPTTPENVAHVANEPRVKDEPRPKIEQPIAVEPKVGEAGDDPEVPVAEVDPPREPEQVKPEEDAATVVPAKAEVPPEKPKEKVVENKVVRVVEKAQKKEPKTVAEVPKEKEPEVKPAEKKTAPAKFQPATDPRKWN